MTYVALHTQATGIHPSTGRLLTLDAAVFDDAGVVTERVHHVFNPGMDAGPRHVHGLEVSDFAQAPRFARHLKGLDVLIDGAVLLTHSTPLTWGYLVSESRRAMNAAARANRSRRGRGNRRRQRVGHVPRPELVVDVLASTQRQGHIPVDTRLNPLAELVGVQPGPEATDTLMAMFFALREAGELAQFDPADLAADRFGLQRSTVRVDAAKVSPAAENPGVFVPGRGLAEGMEVVVTDDIAVDPDHLIDAAVRAGLSYQEKLTRETSLVVSDALAKGVELRGKAMHAHRKDIPILTADEFARELDALATDAHAADASE